MDLLCFGLMKVNGRLQCLFRTATKLPQIDRKALGTASDELELFRRGWVDFRRAGGIIELMNSPSQVAASFSGPPPQKFRFVPGWRTQVE